MKSLGIVFWLLWMSLICYAQDSITDRKSSVVLGGDLLYNSNHQTRDEPNYKKINLSGNVKFGYFFSSNDLVLIRPRITGEFTSSKTSGYNRSEIAFGGELVYRRFFGTSLFGGVFIGGEYDREYSSAFLSGKPQYDKEVYAGLELGYVTFLNPRVGLESAVYYSARKRDYVRTEYTQPDYYSKVGITLGFIYLFKQQYHEKQ